VSPKAKRPAEFEEIRLIRLRCHYQPLESDARPESDSVLETHQADQIHSGSSQIKERLVARFGLFYQRLALTDAGYGRIAKANACASNACDMLPTM